MENALTKCDEEGVPFLVQEATYLPIVPALMCTTIDGVQRSCLLPPLAWELLHERELLMPPAAQDLAFRLANAWAEDNWRSVSCR